jgi:tripartite ATP-independent transporter DctP family solute receptor
LNWLSESKALSRRKFIHMAIATGATVGASSVLDACGGAAPTPKDTAAFGPQVTVHIGDTVADPNPELAAERWFGQRLNQLTNGEYTLVVHPNSTLGSATAMGDQVRAGTLQFVKSSSGNVSAYDKRLSIVNLPYAFTSDKQTFAAEDGKLGQAYGDILAQYDLKFLGFMDGGTRNIYNTKGPIKTPADLKALNLRIRVITDPIYTATFKQLGAQPIPMDPSQIFGALQQGVIDAAENNVPFYVAQHHNEIAKYFSWTKHSRSYDPWLVSAKWFNEQNKKSQDAIMQAAHETIIRERQLWVTGEKTAIKEATDSGDKFNDADVKAFQQAAQPVWEANKTTFGNLYPILLQAIS